MIPDTKDLRRFEQARIKVLTNSHDPHGFGTLAEKTLHAVMKQYYIPDEDYHEVPIEGYIADIYTGEEIIEIQNGNFGHMRDKLTAFLPEYQVYLVYPFQHTKWIITMDPQTGEKRSRRKSPITGSIYLALPEFFRIRAHLTHPNLHIRVPLIDMEEYRVSEPPSGKERRRRRKSTRKYDSVPISIYDEVILDHVSDYLQLLPYDLPDEFTTADLAASASIQLYYAQETCKLLYDIGVIARVGKRGNSYLYRIYEEM